MQRLFLLFLLLLVARSNSQAQNKYMTKTGRISFFSATPVEDIEAQNQQVAAVFDFSTNQLAFTLPIKGFVFKRTLMQEHFNENYLESDKFPKSTFTGRLLDFDAATLATAGPHNTQVAGELTMHGVTRHIQVPATLEIKNGQLLAAATFTVASADYNIEIPLLVRSNIAKEVSVRIALACVPAPSIVGATARPTN